MRLPKHLLLLVAFSRSATDAFAFSPNNFAGIEFRRALAVARVAPHASSSVRTGLSSLNTDEIDCGCGPTIFSGKPSDMARNLNPREAIRSGSIFNLDAEEIRMDDLLGKSPVSIVVFMRSLG